MPPFKEFPPASEVTEGDYDATQLQAPILTGRGLQLFVKILESRFVGLIRGKLMRDNGFTELFEETSIPEAPTFMPNTRGWRRERGAFEELGPDLSAAQRAAKAYALTFGDADAEAGRARRASWKRYTVADFYQAYSSKRVTPVQVAENVIAAVEEGMCQSPPLFFFTAFDPELVRAAAKESAARWAAGQPLSPLDGVPTGIKDLTDCLPYKTAGGTSWMADWHKVTSTNACARALQDAGAMILGKLATHEIGIGTTGLNPVAGTPLNPWDPCCHTGGSSSGSCAAVAAGLMPLALGSDGGGSIRIPSSLCGCVGLKPTHDRLDHAGGQDVDYSVAVIGPIAASVADCALGYGLMADAAVPAEDEQLSIPVAVNRPPVVLPAKFPVPGPKPLAGTRIGVYWKWFEHADPEVVSACRAALTVLESAGGELVQVALPELRAMNLAHSVTITSEMRGAMTGPLASPLIRGQMNLDTRGALAFAAGFPSAWYVQAQKLRTRAETHFRRAFAACDVLVTPGTPITAPRIRPEALRGGQSDINQTTTLMRYVTAANLLGFPGLVVPVGLDKAGMPIGLQLMAPAWHDATLLHAGMVLESQGVTAGVYERRPKVWFDVLKPSDAA